MYITAQGVNSALQCSLVSFSCIGFHCIYSLFMLNLAKDEHCPPLKCLCHLEFWALYDQNAVIKTLNLFTVA